MIGFEEEHGFPLEAVEIEGHRVVSKMGSVNLHARDAGGNIVHAVAGFYCPVEGCRAIHPELTMGRLLSMS